MYGRRKTEESLNLTYQDVITILGHFLVLSTCSIATGIIFGLVCSYTFKNLKDLDKH